MQSRFTNHEMHDRLWALLSVDQSTKVIGGASGLSTRIHHENGAVGLSCRRNSDYGCLSLSELVVAAPPGLALPKDKVIVISVVEGPSKGLACRVAKPHITIGRSGGGADMEINDRYVSTLHCAIAVKRDIIRLRDLDSRNGTYVGNQRVSIVSLGHRSEFCVGFSVLLVTLLPARAVTPGEEVNEFAEGKES